MDSRYSRATDFLKRGAATAASEDDIDARF
jgi:hypothetical protein